MKFSIEQIEEEEEEDQYSMYRATWRVWRCGCVADDASSSVAATSNNNKCQQQEQEDCQLCSQKIETDFKQQLVRLSEAVRFFKKISSFFFQYLEDLNIHIHSF